MKKITQNHQLTDLIDDFILRCKKGTRRYANGRRISNDTVENYRILLKRLEEFEIATSMKVRVISELRLSKKQFAVERKYWKKFFTSFTSFLHKEGGFDNYVGFMIKNLRAVLQYAQDEYMIGTSSYRKQLYVIKEDVPIITLAPEQLRFLIHDVEFRNRLNPELQTVLDIFIVGCTVALRYSDLIGISWRNIEQIGNGYYLAVSSIKTRTPTRVRLPDYVLKSLEKYKKIKHRKTIFPQISLSWFNIQLRRICELAGWQDECGKYRSRNGKKIELKNPRTKKPYRFCDLVSSHVMRKTGITTMLMNGVPELVVRKISGHSSTSPAFLRYVNFVQGYLDREVDKHHEIMRHQLSAVSRQEEFVGPA
jgi:hypothetical protein